LFKLKKSVYICQTKQLLIMDKYKEIYNKTCRVQVKKVKLGDVTYHANCRVAMLEDALQKAEEKQVEYKDRGNENLVEWYQGQIEAYKLSLGLAKDLVKTYNNL